MARITMAEGLSAQQGAQRTRVLMVATSYPRNAADWQGLFIRKIADSMGDCPELVLSLWAPDGPRHPQVDYACDEDDRAWLDGLAERGGIAHLLRTAPLSAGVQGLGLLRRLRRLYRARAGFTDIFHINWLQNALPLHGLGARAVITVLGTDFKLLKLPAMATLLRRVLKTNRCILAPNAGWMADALERQFGDLAEVRPVNFGIDARWYELQCPAPSPGEVSDWLCVLRVTEEKIGRLFEWGAPLFGPGQGRRLHLVGPNQGGVSIPEWVNFHGPLPAQELIGHWYPRCSGFITLSEHSEGRPQVLLETLAAGMPVIASAIPAHAETITEDEQGYLVDSAESFGRALARLSEPDNHQRLAQLCRSNSAREYGTWQDCLVRYRALYGELV